MSNPYQSPSFDPKQFQDYPSPFPPPQNTGFGWVQQVRVVAILNCVQGGLECLMGTFLVGMAVFVPIMIRMEQRNNPGINSAPAGMEWIMVAVYGGIGGVVLIAGVLRIYAGLQNFRYRKRVLGIVSLVCGLASMIGCYCAPTSIALLIYGLIVYLHPAVQTAFEMGDKGTPADAILSSFLPYPQQNYGQTPFAPPPSDKMS
ncbi:MAG: hypothetical protein ACR2FY_09125 [Pirellulaceae bacterium]